MQKRSDRPPKDVREQKALTERDRSEMWKAHMQDVLAQNPANHGCTVLMRRKNRTYYFVIPGLPIPKVENPVKEKKGSKPSKRKPQTTPKRKAIS